MKLKQVILIIPGILSLMLGFSHSAVAQTIEGDWYGIAHVQGIELRLTVHVKAAADGYTSTWDSPDQGAFDVPSSTTTFAYPDFSFTHEGAGFKYAGKVNASYTEITGNLEQGGVKLDIVFGRKPIAAAPNSPDALKQKYDKQEIYITMRDGVRLFTSVYTPKNNSVQHPVLLNRTPYNI